MRASGHERQRSDRYLLQLRRPDAPGGQTGPHSDGWGITFYDGKGCRSFHDPRPSAESEIARFVRSYSIKSTNVICHIRRANRGRVALENTHPFIRELWGRYWSFAHNGQLKGDQGTAAIGLPAGRDDRQRACLLLDAGPVARALGQATRLQGAVPRDPETGGGIERQGRVQSPAVRRTVAVLLCSTNLAWLTRRHPFGNATLLDEDLTRGFRPGNHARAMSSAWWRPGR